MAGAAIHEVASKPSGARTRVSNSVKNSANYVSKSVPGRAAKKVGSGGERIVTNVTNHPIRTALGTLGASYAGQKIGEKAAKNGVPRYIVRGSQIVLAAGGAHSPVLGVATGLGAAGWTSLKPNTKEAVVVNSARAARNTSVRVARGARAAATAALRRAPRFHRRGRP